MSHTVYRLVPTSMNLNGVIALILCFAPISIALLTKYVTAVVDRLIRSVKYCLSVPVFHFGHNYPTLQHGLSVIAELLVLYHHTLPDCQSVLRTTMQVNENVENSNCHSPPLKTTNRSLAWIMQNSIKIQLPLVGPRVYAIPACFSGVLPTAYS